MIDKKVLNVGGGSQKIIPYPLYDGWTQHVLDIDPDVNPDFCCDINDVKSVLPEGSYDAVFSSHCLEHVYQHQVNDVLDNMKYLLKDDGFVEIWVPNLKHLIQELIVRGLDLSDTYYRTTEGTPITFHDVLYGWSAAMKKGNLYYAHNCGFTPISLRDSLERSGFKRIIMQEHQSNLMAVAYK